MKGIIDRIENDYAIVEIKNGYFNFKLEKFPKSIKEGDIVKFDGVTFKVLKKETKIRKNKIEKLFNSLLE